jgi:hypothetical protein
MTTAAVINATSGGFSASVIGMQFVAYVAVDSSEDANKAVEVLKAV